jgi:Holliday junction resolvase RusA-like endonuclease
MAEFDVPGFVVRGAPRSKKNSPRIFTTGKVCRTCGKRDGFPSVHPSLAYEEWEADAIRQCMTIKPKLRAAGVELPIVHPISIEALFYLAPTKAGSMRLDCPDLSNLLEALADMLQEAGIIQDDRLIEDWDGSRRLLGEPRVEVFIAILSKSPVQGKLPAFVPNSEQDFA